MGTTQSKGCPHAIGQDEYPVPKAPVQLRAEIALLKIEITRLQAIVDKQQKQLKYIQDKPGEYLFFSGVYRDAEVAKPKEE